MLVPCPAMAPSTEPIIDNEPSATKVWPVVVGPKKDEKQQMHIIKAKENKPSLLPVGETLGFLSRTKEISPSSS